MLFIYDSQVKWLGQITNILTQQYSRSEVMLTFFERSPLDQVLRNDKVHRIQPCIQSPIKISGEWPAVCCNMEPLSPLQCHTNFRANEILLCTLFSFFRNHAIQWILSGQHRNHRIWWESPWRKRKTFIHWLCGTFVRKKKLLNFCHLSQICLVPVLVK